MSAEALIPLQSYLQSLLQQSVQKLSGEASELNLLLPDDDDHLSLRLQALADWCRGYSVGLLNNDSLAVDQLSADAAEMARDIMAIAEVEAASPRDMGKVMKAIMPKVKGKADGKRVSQLVKKQLLT